MTRKDYILIADKLKLGKLALCGEEQVQGFTVAVNCLVRAFILDNVRFDQSRFTAYLDKEL